MSIESLNYSFLFSIFLLYMFLIQKKLNSIKENTSYAVIKYCICGDVLFCLEIMQQYWFSSSFCTVCVSDILPDKCNEHVILPIYNYNLAAKYFYVVTSFPSSSFPRNRTIFHWPYYIVKMLKQHVIYSNGSIRCKYIQHLNQTD